MTGPSLKHSLEHWTGFRPIERRFEPRRTRIAATKVEKLLGEVQPRAPATYDLRDLHRRVVDSWRRDRAIARLHPRDLRRLPWILFYPAIKGNRAGGGSANGVNPQAELLSLMADTRTRRTDWLGEEAAVLREYGRWLSSGRRVRSVLALVHEFLRVYPVALPTFNELRRLLQDTVEGSSSPPTASLRRWHHRCQDFGLLEEGGAGAFVQKLMSATEPTEDVLRQAGLDAGLARCGFLESGISACLPHAESLLRDDRLGTAQLDRLLTLLACDGRLRFDDRAVRLEVATALLRPFAERRPEPATRKLLQPFFLRHFGDPRLRKHQWSGVPRQMRRVVIRWLNERGLEQFFLLVKETALDSHWRYREAFWRAFLPLDPDIWFVLGRRARSLLRKMNAVSDEPETTATLQGAQGDQSVLLLRLPGATIAEWSHDGACRLWLDGTPGAPILYDKRVYSQSELMRRADKTQRHDGSPVGRWQDQIMDWLRNNTGIEINRAEYFPNRLHEQQRDHHFLHTPTNRGPRNRVAGAVNSPGAQPQTARTETVALLQGVRNAVMDTNTLLVDLWGFMHAGSVAWRAYVADHGPPGHRTRRQTVLDRLDSTIARLRSP